jgi:hypothetical protein
MAVYLSGNRASQRRNDGKPGASANDIIQFC